jgi:hypothetical protein
MEETRNALKIIVKEVPERLEGIKKIILKRYFLETSCEHVTWMKVSHDHVQRQDLVLLHYYQSILLLLLLPMVLQPSMGFGFLF